MKRIVGLALTLCMVACATPHGRMAAPAPRPSAPAASVSVAPPPPALAFTAVGTLEAHGERTEKTKLSLEALAITAKTSGDVAETLIEHVFKSDSDEVLEGTFRFPMPEGALVLGMAMEIDGKLMTGELASRDKARKAYEEVVDAMRDPALLEWEGGGTFKLRVFPIEPKKTKRVVLKLLTPLHRSGAETFFAFHRPTSSDLPTEHVSVVVDGKSASRGETTSTGDIMVRVSDGPVPAVVSEQTDDGTFLLTHVRPELPTEAPPPALRPQALVVLCDRSRSMLEARALQTGTLGMLLEGLAAEDRFTVVTGDVQTRAQGGLHASTPAERIVATSFVDSVEPDGASDLGKLLTAAGSAAADARAQGFEPSIVLLGDTNPTWGETRTSELQKLATERVGAPIHVVLLGKSTDDSVARALAGATHGKVVRPKTERETRVAAEEIIAAPRARRVDDARLVGVDGADVPLDLPLSLYEGSRTDVALLVPKGRPIPHDARIEGTVDGKPFRQALALDAAKPSLHVAERWAKAKIERLERDGDAHKEEVVKTSLARGVMSKYTSFLVLESDEAYARHQIERRAKAIDASDTRVSGRDLDGDGRGPSVSPDHLQPGDPEVRIPAPADAQSVVVVFPFGETKTASYENDEHGGAWVARFLVDRHTPDGNYEIVVRITHHDGRFEILRLPYVVDTQRPNFDITVTPKTGGAFAIHARQRVSEAEIEAQAPTRTGTLEERRQRFAHILTDAKRMEVSTPDGQVLTLTHVRLGEFVGTWTPRGSTAGKLRFVAVDRALNENVTEIDVPH
jgi:hypothetical protein